MSLRMKKKLRYLTVALSIASMTISPLIVSARTPDENVKIISPYDSLSS